MLRTLGSHVYQRYSLRCTIAEAALHAVSLHDARAAMPAREYTPRRGAATLVARPRSLVAGRALRQTRLDDDAVLFDHHARRKRLANLRRVRGVLAGLRATRRAVAACLPCLCGVLGPAWHAINH